MNKTELIEAIAGKVDAPKTQVAEIIAALRANSAVNSVERTKGR